DFAARGADFQALVQASVDAALKSGAPTDGAAPTEASREALLDAPGTSGRSLRQTIGEAVGKIGENMQLRRYVKVQKSAPASVLASYIHTGGKIGVLLEAESVAGGVPDGLLRDLAMHVAAAAPRYVTRDEVSAKVLADEQEIARDQALKAGKPPQVVEKIVSGRVDKFLGEVTLVEQPFVKDPDKTVKQLLGDGVRVRRFARFVLGEGL